MTTETMRDQNEDRAGYLKLTLKGGEGQLTDFARLTFLQAFEGKRREQPEAAREAIETTATTRTARDQRIAELDEFYLAIRDAQWIAMLGVGSLEAVTAARDALDSAYANALLAIDGAPSERRIPYLAINHYDWEALRLMPYTTIAHTDEHETIPCPHCGRVLCVRYPAIWNGFSTCERVEEEQDHVSECAAPGYRLAGL